MEEEESFLSFRVLMILFRKTDFLGSMSIQWWSDVGLKPMAIQTPCHLVKSIDTLPDGSVSVSPSFEWLRHQRSNGTRCERCESLKAISLESPVSARMERSNAHVHSEMHPSHSRRIFGGQSLYSLPFSLPCSALQAN